MPGKRLPLDVRLDVRIKQQPDEITCGATCLDAVYRYYDDVVPLKQVIAEIPQLESGGTIAPFLGLHALDRGYDATLYTWDLNTFDPTWFRLNRRSFRAKLNAQAKAKSNRRTITASRAYAEFVDCGGTVRFRDLTAPLLRGLIRRKVPVIAGLSSTYLHRQPREFGPQDLPDDVLGEPAGHFVVLSGYRRRDRLVRVSDPYRPYLPKPTRKNQYWVNINRLICGVLLGTLTFDANLLVITPPARAARA